MSMSSKRAFDRSTLPNEAYHTIGNPIDQGGYGIVAAVEQHTRPGIIFARKQLFKSRVRVDMLQKEVDLIRKATHHHVVSIVDQYEDDQSYFIVMKPLAKCNLRSYLDEVTSSNPDSSEAWESFGQRRLRLFQWIHSLAITLRHLHERHICHRDIKPQNILVGIRSPDMQIQEEPLNRELYLADFGISFAHDGQTKTTLTTTIGTKKYEPPEALVEQDSDMPKRARIGRKGDIFSLGCVFLEILEAASHPLGVKFPLVQNCYADVASDPHWRKQIQVMREHPVKARKLPADSRHFGLTNELLNYIISNMVTAEHRQSAAEISEGVERIMGNHGVVLAECCILPKDPELKLKGQIETAQMNSNSLPLETIGRSDVQALEFITSNQSSISKVDRAIVYYAQIINQNSHEEQYIKVVQDPTTPVNWISPHLVAFCGFKIIDPTQPDLQLDARLLAANRKVQIPLVGRNLRAYSTELVISPELFPADIVVVGSQFIGTVGHANSVFSMEPPEGETLIIIQHINEVCHCSSR